MRVDNARDTSISKRDDIILDIVDALKAIKKISGYKTDPKTIVQWRINTFQERELPAIDVFDYESEEDDNLSRVKHTLDVSIEYIDVSSKSDSTSEQLRLGASDILKALGAIQDRYCVKYNTKPMRFTGTSMGLDSKAKIDGGISVMIRLEYATPVWEL